MKTIQEIRNDVFIEKFWDSLVRSNGQIMTQKQLFERDKPTFKKIYTQEYSNKKVCLTYAKLKNPKVTYSVHFETGFCRDFPKIVWDSLSLESQ